MLMLMLVAALILVMTFFSCRFNTCQVQSSHSSNLISALSLALISKLIEVIGKIVYLQDTLEKYLDKEEDTF